MNESSKAGQPVQWLYIILLGVPTFFMPLAYLSLAVWVLYGMFSGGRGDIPEFLSVAGDLAMNVTLVMWPVYIAWVIFSTRLSRREKIGWLLVVVVLNMVGMPAFYVFIVRRYMGLEGRYHSEALDKFMSRHKLNAQNFTSKQLEVLKIYSARHRLAKLVAMAMFLVGLILLTGGVVFTVNQFDGFFQGLIGVESFADPDPIPAIPDSPGEGGDEEMTRMEYEIDRLFFIFILFGCAGLILNSLILLFQPVSMCLSYMSRKAFMEFLKVTGKES